MLHAAVSLALAGTALALTDIDHKPLFRKNMDPIVSPGRYVSHMHSFYGSDAITNKLPTTAELQTGCPSGENPNDLSIYWVPTLYYVNGNTYTEIYPATFKTYYEQIHHAQIPFPRDFFAIAGNASAKSQADINEKVSAITWWCDTGADDRNVRPRAALPRSTCGAHLQAILRFPDCVDPNNIKDYTYAAASPGNTCPKHMKRLPSLRFSIRYNTRAAIPQGWKGIPPIKLACGEIGEGYCLHGDFINGWYDDAQANMMKATGQNFMRIDGAHGIGKIPFNQNCKPKDRNPPGEGTSDYHKSVEMMKMAK